MIKDYLPASSSEKQQDDLAYVEAFWTHRFAGREGRRAPETLCHTDEFRLMASFLAGVPAKGRLLDGGCGTGEWTLLWSQKGWQTTGLDISAPVIVTLQKLFPEQAFVRGDLRATGLPAESFEAAFSWGAIEHFENGPSESLKEMWRITRPGGLLFVTVPYAGGRVRHANRCGGMDVDLALAHNASAPHRFYQWRFEEQELRRELQLAGWAPLLVRPIHKTEGLARMLSHGGIKLDAGAFLGNLALRLLGLFVPAKYACHMLMAVAKKT